MSNPPPLQSLDDLLARAEDFALFSMRSGSKVPPAVEQLLRELSHRGFWDL
ncbi:MAG: hypothetical protein Q7S40_22425 [Opitutaceae bacterium]|nr:hypothetical protein [Opitutaceae bacterium]